MSKPSTILILFALLSSLALPNPAHAQSCRMTVISLIGEPPASDSSSDFDVTNSSDSNPSEYARQLAKELEAGNITNVFIVRPGDEDYLLGSGTVTINYKVAQNSDSCTNLRIEAIGREGANIATVSGGSVASGDIPQGNIVFLATNNVFVSPTGRNINAAQLVGNATNIDVIVQNNSDVRLGVQSPNGAAVYARTETGNITLSGDGTGNISSLSDNSFAAYLEGGINTSITGINVRAEGDNSIAVASTATLLIKDAKVGTGGADSDAIRATGSVTIDGSVVSADGGNSSAVRVIYVAPPPRSQPRAPHAGRSAFSGRGSGGVELNIGNGSVVCAGVVSGSACAPGANAYAVRFEAAHGSTGNITTTIGAGGSVTGAVSLSENHDVVYNNGSFTGSGSTGEGDDTIENRGNFTLIGDFDMGEGADVFENLEGGTVVYGGGETAQSASGHSTAPGGITPSASGDSRFRLSASPPASAPSPPETLTINFGGGDDHFINNGTIVIEETGGFNGLEKITFGENSTVMVVTADSTEMTTDKPLIELEGEITAEDVKDLNIKLANPERHSDEFALFSETALPDNEAERQAVLSMISGGLGEGSSAGVDSNGNIFVVLANSVHFNYLRNYDAMIQSAYHSDSAFSEKLRGSCYGGEAETQDLQGGCLWADAGSRHTRHDTKVKYGEDAYVFAGGLSIPAGQSAVSIGAGYETSDFNAGTDTNAAGERFMAGLSVAGEIWKRIIADARTQFAKAAWESTSARGEDTYSAKTDITTWSAAIGAEMPFFPGGVFMVVPRLEAGVARVSADSFTETGGGDMPLKVGGLSQTYLRVTPSVTAYAPAGESVNMWMTAGADAHLTDPKTDLKAAFSPDDPVNTKGGFERINIRYSAGAEVNPLKGVSVRVAYSGGVSTTFDTLTQTFTARFGVAF